MSPAGRRANSRHRLRQRETQSASRPAAETLPSKGQGHELEAISSRERGPRGLRDVGRAFCRGAGPNHRDARLPWRHHHHRWQAAPAARPEVRRCDQPERRGLQALLAADHRPAQGSAQRAAHHDRRPGLRRHEHLRRRDPDAGDGPDREGGIALHAVPLDRPLLADARGADHRPQPPLGGLRSDLGAVHGIPGLRLHHRQEQRHDRRDPQGERLRHVVVRQEPQHSDLCLQPGRTLRPVAERNGLPVLLRVHGGRDQPVDALSLPGSHADLSVAGQDRITT